MDKWEAKRFPKSKHQPRGRCGVQGGRRVSRDHEEKEGGKKARAKLCTKQRSSVRVVWLGRGKDKESDKDSTLFPAPRVRRGSSEAGFVFIFLRNERVARGAEFEIERCNNGLGFGEQKVCFCRVAWSSLSLGQFSLKVIWYSVSYCGNFFSLQMLYLSRSRKMACWFKQARISHVF